MAKTSHLSHVIIMQTTKPHAASARNLGARARKTELCLKSPEYIEPDQTLPIKIIVFITEWLLYLNRQT